MNPSFTDAKITKGRSKTISCSCRGSLKSTERRYQRFFYRRQILKARTQKPKSICVELNVR